MMAPLRGVSDHGRRRIEARATTMAAEDADHEQPRKKLLKTTAAAGVRERIAAVGTQIWIDKLRHDLLVWETSEELDHELCRQPIT